jgi:peptide subunit release factor RF-3
MPGHQYTPAEYTLQSIVESVGTMLFELAEHRLTHTYTVVFRFCQFENLDHLVRRYLSTGALPFEEFSEEWLHDNEI